MKDFDWKLINMSLFCCRTSGIGRGDKPTRTVEHLRSQKFFEAEERLLEELMDSLLSAGFTKKTDINDTSPCRAFNFKDSDGGHVDQDMLGEMLAAPDLKTFEARALVLSERYAQLPRSREGILIHATATIDSGRCKSLPFYFLFKCDFEDARQMNPEGIIESVPEIIINKLKKMFVYPMYNGFEQDGDRVKVFQSSAADYFHELLDISPPTSAKELFQRELKEAVATRYQDRFNDYFVGEPPPKRELFAEERYIPLNDLLPAPEVRFFNDKTCIAAKEKYDKPIRTSIKIDATTKVDADMSGLGKTFFFAKKGDLRYMIIRGEHFVGGGPLSGLDFLEVEELDDVLPRIMEEVVGGVAGGEDA